MGMMRQAIQGEPAPDATRLNPRFRYLRVTVDGRVSFLALGNLENENDPRGPVEVWYSARKEVLRLRNGRLVGAVGVFTEWRDVSLPAFPAWSEISRSRESHRWVRTRDVMPGYRYGVRDTLELRPVSPPERTALVGRDPTGLTWFEERSRVEPPSGMLASLVSGTHDVQALPPARYAVEIRDGREKVVYGEQCLSAEFCFTWQRWTVAPRNDKKK